MFIWCVVFLFPVSTRLVGLFLRRRCHSISCKSQPLLPPPPLLFSVENKALREEAEAAAVAAAAAAEKQKKRRRSGGTRQPAGLSTFSFPLRVFTFAFRFVEPPPSLACFLC